MFANTQLIKIVILLSVPKFTVNLYCICISIPQEMQYRFAVKFWTLSPFFLEGRGNFCAHPYFLFSVTLLQFGAQLVQSALLRHCPPWDPPPPPPRDIYLYLVPLTPLKNHLYVKVVRKFFLNHNKKMASRGLRKTSFFPI